MREYYDGLRKTGKTQCRTWYERECENCGSEFRTQHRRTRFCSQKCNASQQDYARLSRYGMAACLTTKVRECRFCQREFYGTSYQDFCSEECVKLRRKPFSAVFFPTCRVCGSLFCARRSDQVFCGRVCSSTFYNSRRRGYLKHRERLFSEQSGECWLCGFPIEWGDDVNDDLYIHVDHLIPRSHGGSDEYCNLAVSHRSCNIARSDSIEVVHLPHPLI